MDDLEIAARFEKNEKDIAALQSCATDTRVWQAENGAYIREIKDKMTQFAFDLKELASKPQKRWDTVVTTAIIAIVTGVVGYILAFAK